MNKGKTISIIIMSYALIPILFTKAFPDISQYMNAFSFFLFGMFFPIVGNILYKYFGLWLTYSTIDFCFGMIRLVLSGFSQSLFEMMDNLPFRYEGIEEPYSIKIAHFLKYNPFIFFFGLYIIYSVFPLIVGLLFGKFINKHYKLGVIK